ncbi:MAG TPA: DUF1800 domain-containing protein [Pyrinomonadaceae bacterium]|jgi:hypothetical protein
MSKNFPDGLSLRLFRCVGVCLLIIVSSALGAAQSRTRPDTPVLISEDGSTRALSVNPYRWRGKFPTPSQTVWTSSDETRVTLFLTNLDLMKGEGANAFRADAEDANGRQFPLTVESLTPVNKYEWIYATVVRLNGQIGDAGDVLVRVTWRGMATNRVRLALGHPGGGIKDDEGATPTAAPLVPPKPYQDAEPNQLGFGAQFSGDRMRFMEQATFGPTADLDLRLRRIGIYVYMGEQFDLPYPGIAYPVLPPQTTQIPGTCTGDCIRDNYSMYPLQRWFFQDAVYGKAQLRRRVAWALSQIFVVSGVDTQQPSQYLPYLQVLDRNAFGNYRTLLGEITLNTAMGNYLDMVRSTKTNPNENYAREVLQLFSVGLVKLNPDGTPQCLEHNPCQAGDTQIPTYDQNVVNGFTKVFTGWNFAPPQIPGITNYIDPMTLVPANHDTTSKLLLDGVTLPANQTGAQDLNAALDNIFNNPSVGPFISRQLIQHLVTSDPTPAYVGRVAAVFNNNGYGVRGDLKAVVRAILADPEARGDVKTDPNYGYLREPALFVTNILRQFNARAASGAAGSQSDGYLDPQTIAMSQDVFRPPSVFNYYPPDYIVPVSGIKGPEFYLMNTSTALKRTNFGNTIVFNTIPATTGGNTNAPFGTSLDLSEMQALAAADASGVQLMDALNRKLMHGSMSAQMRSIITTAVLAAPSSNPLLRARTAIYLVATSSQYQVQR